MVVTRAELAKQKFEPRATGLLEDVLRTAGCFIGPDTKEVKISQEPSE